MLRHIRKQW